MQQKMKFSQLYADIIAKRRKFAKAKNATDLQIEYFYCFDEFAEGTHEQYEQMCELCKQHGIRKVVDIGSCYAFQQRIFFQVGIDYLGIEKLSHIAYHSYATLYYIHHATYPVKYRTTDRKHTAAISNLCVGYEARSNEVYEQIAQDFDYFCGGIDAEIAQKLKKYFNVTKLDDYLYWCERVK